MPDCLMRKKEVALGTEWLQRMLDTGVAADEASWPGQLMLNAFLYVSVCFSCILLYTAEFIGYKLED